MLLKLSPSPLKHAKSNKKRVSLKMKNIAFIEPPYRPEQPEQWALNGKYRYPSILGKLSNYSHVIIAMPCLPPTDDALRRILEVEFKVQFVEIPDGNAQMVANFLKKYKIDIVSNLWGRPVNQLERLIKISGKIRADFVMRVGGDDIATKSALAQKNNVRFENTEKHRKLLEIEKHIVKASKKIIVMSKLEAARVQKVDNSVTLDISVCLRGVDQKKFYPKQNWHKIEPRTIIFVGRESPEKGYDLFDKIADHFLTKNPSIKFRYVGNFSKKMIENREYTGFIDPNDLPQQYQSADIFLNCSRTEGFPQTLMEAMSMGLPGVIPRHLFSEEFSDTNNGILFTDNSVNDIIKKLERLLLDKSYYALNCIQALAFAREHFDNVKNNKFYIDTMIAS